MESGERRRLVISEDDLESATTSPPTTPPGAHGDVDLSSSAQPVGGGASPPSTAEFPSVQGSHAPPRQIDGARPYAGTRAAPLTFNSIQGRSLAAACAAIAVGWAFCEITNFGLWTPHSEGGANFSSGAYVGALGLFFAVVYSGWEHILARSTEGIIDSAKRAAPWGAGLGFIAGFIAQAVYTPILKNILNDVTLADLGSIDSNVKLYLARALAWGLFGLGMGAASAVLVPTRDKLINGMIGGALGGAIGGVVFHWASFNVDSQAMSRLVGLLVVGAAIGGAIGLIETARREAWLHITGGGMVGKEFILYLPETAIGSSPKCDVTLIKDPSIAPFHFVIRASAQAGGQRRTVAAYEGCVVSVNGAVTPGQQLRNGDVITVGSTTIAYSERAVPAMA